MTFASNSTFDIAFWFADQALNENEYLQPQKLHRLLYLAQAFYAIAYDGQKLMPAVFVADDMGPIEPTMFQAFSNGRPDVNVELFLASDVEIFLMSIWRRFGHQKPEQLSKMTNRNAAYSIALRKGPRTEISLHSMVTTFKAETEKKAATPVQPVNPDERVFRTQDGASVQVKSWAPGLK
ncbi:MAG: hypothetical protein JKY92_04520 [Magnetovibrio sp.]|nr:hypothetical protein [Magnetovibrio sp.]